MYTPPKRRKITREERKAVYDKYGGHCAYCGQKIEPRQMQVDHYIPMEFHDVYEAQGVELDAMDNFMPACRSCNNYKHSLMPEKFRAAIERWCDVLNRDNVTYRNAVRFRMVKPTPHKVTFYFERLEGRNSESI